MGEQTVVRTDEATAQALVDAVCDRRTDGIAAVLAPDACMRALLPGGLREWSDAEAIAGRFAGWFGDADVEVLEREVRRAERRVQVRWRLRVRAERLGEGWRVVEQVAYVDGDGEGRLTGIDLLCTGYLPQQGADGGSDG